MGIYFFVRVELFNLLKLDELKYLGVVKIWIFRIWVNFNVDGRNEC